METVILVYEFAADMNGAYQTFIVPSGWTLPPLIDSIPHYFEELGMWILQSI